MGMIGSTARPVMLVLAAGLAKRMGGRSKPDLPWERGVLLDRPVEASQSAGFAVVTVSARPRPGAVINPHPESGLAESLKVGLRAVRADWGAAPVGVLLADQPFVTVEDIVRVREAFFHRAAGIHAVRARYAGRPGHPVLFDPEWDKLVFNLDGDRGLGSLWQGRRDVEWVDCPTAGRPDPSFDIDTEEAYQQALEWAH